MGMLVRLVFALLMSVHLFAQCDDVAISTKEARHASDVVFQGVIEGFRDAGKSRTVIFRVSRVWKGQVGPTFEMPAIETTGGLCTAFWKGQLGLGNELVVFASRNRYLPGEGVEYLPLRQKSVLVGKSMDISALGRGHRPKGPPFRTADIP
jgi:hypothetical protein